MNHLDLISACREDWDAYTQHTFVQQLGQATLKPHCFLHYLKQDFLFLKQYARAYALAIYKARTFTEMRYALNSVYQLLDSEIAHHIQYCQQWQLTEADLETEVEDFGTVAYTRYVLDAGMRGDIVELYAALAPCALGYAEIGRHLLADNSIDLSNHPYASWITLYSDNEFQQGVTKTIEHLDHLLAEIDINSQRGQDITMVFNTATRMEIAFWQQGLNA
ncbi:thiaminase II [Shewanella marina]|uniref:thiaminase II n=1 Tax=Shewanella marina TaxID=487319 RepID=UPI00047120D4|nr:thiaminase II [Shewanella marina]